MVGAARQWEGAGAELIDYAWRPQAGPQHAFVTCPYFDVLFGGARGGGKSDGCLGEFAIHAKEFGKYARGVFMRREMPQADSLIDRSQDIYGPMGWTYQKVDRQWTSPEGAILRFRPLEDDRDAEKYQGQQFCVAVGTAVRLADGTFTPIEAIRPGDFVATLLGPRVVRSVVAPYVAECVRVLVRDANGVVLGEQAHPVWHPVLTTVGLISSRTEECSHIRERSARAAGVASKPYAKSLCGEDQGNQAWFSYSEGVASDCAASVSKHRVRRPLAPSSVRIALHEQTARSKASSCLYCLGSPTRCSDLGTRCEWCCNQRRVQQRVRRRLLTDRVRLGERALSLWSRVARYFASVSAYALNGWSRVQGSLVDYRFVGDFCGGLSLQAEGSGLARTPSQADAATPFRVTPSGVWGTIPTHSHHQPRSWVHPYTGAALHLAEAVQNGTMELLGYERALVADLCVEEANHYITDTGLINKNTRVYLEELTNWPTPRASDKMKATLRSAAGVRCLFRATANPGGSGHHWVKARYIDPAPMGRVPLVDEAGHLERMFIPARVHDNVILLTHDPGYVDRLKLTGSAALVKAWLEGDWNVIEGAFFDNWATARHVTSAFPIPEHWLRFRSGDWGSARPFAFQWHAIASEDSHLPNGMVLPRGGMVLYREWYGASGPNVGLKLTAEVVGLGLLQRSEGETYAYSVLDPAAFAQDGGPSIAERIARSSKIIFRPADNKRIGQLGHIAGWDLCRHRLDGEAPDRPMFVTFDTCSDFIRTVPLLQHDADRMEDVDTDGEDHDGDAFRYACASRPWIKPTPQKEPPLTTLADVTLNQLWKVRGGKRPRV